ncbi:alpha/beta hydrolase [Sphingosinicella sp. YJ22]|uniref:alpha/beta hydrolase n=1 Tax=Sphingosinicella sp. YJ22 TaxID=1104780 RepID=UPI001FB025E2|nr:alpha/beta hydrolase [Sphingosinicella sp. YJ22]
MRSKTAAEPARLARVLAGLRKYQEAPRPAPTPGAPVLAERRGAALRDYGGDGPDLLFVPSLINPPTVLDLGDRSLLRWLAGQGRRVLLLDWGWPDEARHGLSVAGHIEEILLPLMTTLGEPPDLAGYCLGGTMAAAGAQLGGARSLVTIAAPWRFHGFPQAERERLAGLWNGSKAVAERLGVLPMEALQVAFWSLDPDRTVRKFEEFAGLEGEAAASFVALEDWANDGPPMGHAAAREMFEDLFGADLPGSGRWRIGGETTDPASLPCPLLNIVSTSDRIVPHASAITAGERIDLARGHVGMIVGSKAKEELWRPLASWLSRVSPN